MTADSRSVLITGGTGALGLLTAQRIAAAGAGCHVVITGRDANFAREAASRITDRTGTPTSGLRLELASLQDVRRFAADFLREDLPPLEAIICNAGRQIRDVRGRTIDGLEPTFAINHLGHFLLVRLLLPVLRPTGRIIFVASETHDPAKHTGMPAAFYADARTLAYPEVADDAAGVEVGRRRYATSKLCNVLTTYELARRISNGELGSRTVTVNAFDPGLMPGTGLARDYHGFTAFAWRYLLPALIAVPGVNAHSVGRSASALARLVLDPGLGTVTAQYFSGTKPRRSSADSYDPAKAADLWAASCELVGLN
jgi:NAD(P)-dependent dehydrogenase (short-subunit alcohol dehydrogenase family)